jgi:hypothetical protein
MKSIVLLLCLGCPTLVWSQIGDFQLKDVRQRTYIKINANPDLYGNGFKRFLIGHNYRTEWTDSIRVPVLNLSTDFGGLTPEKEGGGKQTHTLHLKDADDRKWFLRSVRKYPEKVVAPQLKGTIAEVLVNDGISASYPYGVLSIGTLAKAAGVPYFPNTVVYIPDDPKLGEFRSTYKNTLSLLELRDIGGKDAKTFDTYEIIPGLQESHEKMVDEKAVLKARLLDNFIMDFDRHDGQWTWIEKKSGKSISYYPVPKDRDQAFFKGDGLVPRIVSRKPQLGQLQGLSAQPKNIFTFNYAARNFDRYFLAELDEKDWSQAIDNFLSSVTDKVIDEAMKKQPKEIQDGAADDIAGVLKKKKETFKEDMLQYYRFVSKTVSVVGTNKNEAFNIMENEDGTVKVEMKDEKGAIRYSRSFDPSVTKELRIYGLEGDDQFIINGSKSSITIRLIGGPGEDVFKNEAGGGKAFVYDVSFEDNSVSGKGFKNKISKDPMNNEYRRIAMEYNSSSFGVFPEYSRDGGLFLGPSYTVTTHGFRKEPYASKHFFYVTKALSSSAWHLHYDADFIKVGRNTDLLFRSDAKLPTVRTHFFGYGNNSNFDKSKGADYYKVQYTLIDASLMARNQLTSWFQLAYGPVLQYFKILPGKNSHNYITAVHAPSSEVYRNKWYGGGEVKATVNTRNSNLMPTRGIFSNIYARQLVGINNNKGCFQQAGADLSLYTDVLYRNHIVIASSFGAARNFDKFEIPQAQYLGFKQNLRGFRYQRFAGTSRAYNNTELRINFGNANFYLFKGPLGVLAFHDIGRVWVSGDDSNTWHQGYGGGIWLAPFNKTVITALLTSSKEEKALPMVTFGFQF